MNMKSQFLFSMITRLLIIAVLTSAGCTSLFRRPDKPVPPVAAPVFPPQEVVEGGNYSEFVQKNQKIVDECTNTDQCAMALFNLGFVYCYPPSPYHNQSIALQYFEDIIKEYPQSPWALQAKAWGEVVKKCMATEASLQQLKSKVRAKEMTIRELRRRIAESKEVDIEMDRREKELHEQIERSRKIDIEIDRKERQLLQ
jgi:hypothetical protein